MWAWDILDRVQTWGKFTAIVSPTSLETCPTFEKWCPWGELNTNPLQQEDITLVLLDAIPQEWQVQVMEEASHTKAWAVVSRSTLLHEDAEQWLLHNARYLPIRIPKDRVRVYTKGWWKTGTKKLNKTPPGALR
eukprot:3935809-Rhodomonas_salina.1